MKVALCFFGQPRLLNNPYSYLSHKYWILDRYDTDIFVHTWISSENKEFDYADQVKIKSKEINGSDKIILNKYKPKKYIFEPPIKFELSHQSKEVIKSKKEEQKIKWGKYSDFNFTKNNENNHLSQLYSMSKSIELIDKQYDWVILSRFDNYIISFPNLFNLDNNELYLDNKYYDPNSDVNNFSDVIMIGGLEQVKSLNLYDNIDNLIKHIEIFQPEEFKRVAYYQKYKDKIKHYSKILKIPIFLEKRISIRSGVLRSESLKDLQI